MTISPSKMCCRCGEQKALEFFGKNRTKADGLQDWCRECRRQYRKENAEHRAEYDRQYRKENAEHRAEYGRQYRKENAEHRAEYDRQYRKENAERLAERKKKWRQESPWKCKAHQLVSKAMKDGSLIKKPCEKCGSDRFVEAHHEDYSRPLDVVFLCRSCHHRRHAELKEMENEQSKN